MQDNIMKVSVFFDQKIPDSKDTSTGLYTKYQKKLSDTTTRLCETDLTEEDYQNIWHDVEQNLIRFPFATNLLAITFDCYRKYLFSCISSNRLKLRSDNGVLREAQMLPSMDYSNTTVNHVLSLLSREQFDYFINRYFYMDNQVPVNLKYEKRIARIMQLKGNLKILRMNGIKRLLPYPEYYPYYLLYISDDMIMQIGGTKNIIPDEKITELSFVLQRFSILRVSFLIGIFVALVALLIILFQI